MEHVARHCCIGSEVSKRGDGDKGVVYVLHIVAGDAPAMLIVFIEVAQLDTQHRSLYLVKP